MAMSPKAIQESFARLGIPFLPPDHPEFTSGPQIHFLSRTSSPSKRKGSASTTPAGSRSTEPLESNDEN